MTNPIAAAEQAIILCNRGYHSDAIKLILSDPIWGPVMTESRKRDAYQSNDGVLLTLGEALRCAGVIPAALKLLKHSERYAMSIGDSTLASDSLHQLGVLHKENFQDFEEARKCYTAALEIRRDLGDRDRIASSLHELGILEQFSERFTDAMRLYQESLPMSVESLDLYQVANTKAQIGRVQHQEQRFAQAAASYAVAYKMMTLMQSPNLPVLERWVSDLRRVMGDDDLQAAWENGKDDPDLRILQRIRVCLVCKCPVWPVSLGNRSRYGTWCQSPQEHGA